MVLLNFLFFASPIGAIRVEYTQQGISSLRFVEHMGENHTDNPALEQLILADLHGYFTQKNYVWKCAVAPHLGTEFQEKVWNALHEIPAGEAWTYRDIALKIGQAKAAQAVGNANGQNPVLLRIPCHRVIGSNGAMVGYAGELWRKEWLLNHEGYAGLNQQMSLF
jgi:methylated-DNA-[protein]-cysteine S-methyltransferase